MKAKKQDQAALLRRQPGSSRPRERLSGSIPDAGPPPALDEAALRAKIDPNRISYKMLNSEITHGSGIMMKALRVALPLVSRERGALVSQARILTDPNAILEFLADNPDMMVAHTLLERAWACEETMVMPLGALLTSRPEDHVAEFACLFFARAKADYTPHLLQIAPRVRDVYTLGVLCLALGACDRMGLGLRFVWNVYRHLNQLYGSPLDQGPLFGLLGYAERRGTVPISPKGG
ncbi:MAG: hypothetical protein IT463_11630 [Planctomycetes bacterium]|nr:hypothetical protein [Planctomycetota bacterium]